MPLGTTMSKQVKILNLLCLVAAAGLFVAIIVTALTAGDILTTDTLFIMTVCLVMMVMFLASPLLLLKSEGKLPLPGMKTLVPAGTETAQLSSAVTSKELHDHEVVHEEVHFAGTNKLFGMIWLILVVLTLIEIALAYKTMPIHLMLTILLGLSIIKAALIIAYFMHLKFERLSLILSIIPMLVICICLLFVFFPDSFRSSGLRYKFQEDKPVAPEVVEEP